MRILLFSLMVIALAGCSKKAPAADAADASGATNEQAAAEPGAEGAPAEPAPAEPSTVDNAQIAQDLNAVPDTLQKQDYDNAVDTLTAANMTAQTDAQKQAYQDQLYRALDYLRQKAESDARAKEAYERLGKRMMGR